jgi:glycosyltransferase involved in cell wall biosynthesis
MKKLLFLISEDWFFVSHFLPMARAAREAGFEVAVATRVRAHGDRIAAAGCRVIPFEIERGSIAPLELLRGFIRAFRIVRDERPDIVHCIALRMIILGGLPAKVARARNLVVAPTGLGHIWVSDRPIDRLMRAATRFVLGTLLQGARTHYLFENTDDPGEFGLSPAGPAVTIVHGAGVDPAEFPQVQEPSSPPVRIAVVSRMLKSKGVAEAVDAVRIARSRGTPVELDLYGPLDPSNPASIPEATLRGWSAEPGIRWHGSTRDVAAVWREHHIALFLTAYREGVPRALIEAAACGRPIVTTDTVGCRDVVRDGIEGFLVPVGGSEAAAAALVRLAADPALRVRMGEAANKRFHERFTEQAVRTTVGDLYRALRN